MNLDFLGKLTSGFNLWPKDHGVVGIDVGGSSIKVVQLKKEKERAVLETYGELSVGPYVSLAVGQTAKLTEDLLVRMIGEIFKEAGVTAKRAVVSVSVKNSFITTIELPKMSEEELAGAIAFEARKYVPVPLSEVEMNWQIYPAYSRKTADATTGGYTDTEADKALKVDGNKDGRIEVLLTFVHKEVLQKYGEIFKKMGLNVESFEIEIFSAWRASVLKNLSPVMIIDLGAAVSRIVIVDAGFLKFSHSVDRGAQAITTAISRSLNIGFERAEEMKRRIGLSIMPEYAELVKVIEPMVNMIFAEAKQSMLAYRTKYNDSVGKVILTGGGALLKGMVDFTVKSLGVETVLADPFLKTDCPIFLQESLREIGPVFANATGLALKQITK